MARGIPAEVIRHFKAIPLFSGLSQKELRAVVQLATEVDEPAGTTLIREGDQGEELFVLVSGAARVSRKGRSVGELGPGDFFGELAMLTHAPRNATIVTTSDARLFIVSSRDFRRLIEGNSRMAVAMLSAVATRLRQAERSVLS